MGTQFEFEEHNEWHVIGNFAKLVGNRDAIWYATNGEIYDYVQAYHKLQFSTEMTFIHNPSVIDVYICCAGKNYCILTGKTVYLETL